MTFTLMMAGTFDAIYLNSGKQTHTTVETEIVVRNPRKHDANKTMLTHHLQMKMGNNLCLELLIRFVRFEEHILTSAHGTSFFQIKQVSAL